MESGHSSRALALKFNVGKTQMTNILKRKPKLLMILRIIHPLTVKESTRRLVMKISMTFAGNGSKMPLVDV